MSPLPKAGLERSASTAAGPTRPRLAVTTVATTLCGLLGACGAPFAVTDAGTAVGGASSRATLATPGGQLRSADGRLTLLVPAGALTAPVEFTIEGISATAPGALGAAYRVGPAGLKQATAFDVQLELSSDDLARADLRTLALARQSADGRWERFGDELLSTTSRTLRRRALPATGDWALVRTAMLSPDSPVLRAGSVTTFSAQACASRADAERSFALPCSAHGLDTLVSGWLAEGVGTLTPNGATAILTAGPRRTQGRVLAALYEPSLKAELPLWTSVQLVPAAQRVVGAFQLSQRGAQTVEVSGHLTLDRLGPEADPQPFQGRARIDSVTTTAAPGCTPTDAGIADRGSSYAYVESSGAVRLLIDLDLSGQLRCPDAGVVSFAAFGATCGELGSEQCGGPCPRSDPAGLRPTGLQAFDTLDCAGASTSASWQLFAD